MLFICLACRHDLYNIGLHFVDIRLTMGFAFCRLFITWWDEETSWCSADIFSILRSVPLHASSLLFIYYRFQLSHYYAYIRRRQPLPRQPLKMVTTSNLFPRYDIYLPHLFCHVPFAGIPLPILILLINAFRHKYDGRCFRRHWMIRWVESIASVKSIPFIDYLNWCFIEWFTTPS